MATYDPTDDDLREKLAELYQCDCCGELYPLDQLQFISHGALGNSMGDTTQCAKCQAKAREGR